ncbi:HNH endonuclease [Mycobacterium simiae]|uniref:HNH endonuclease n=1 Tax=Mycobacterium simiae TaxID=1784 RepID=UPI002620467F|nr:HNH endonuclease [Mycobacterium simiae]
MANYRAQHTQPGIAKSAGRATRRYRMLRATFREDCRTFVNPDGTVGAHCWLCGRAIDYSLAGDHPEGFNLDHAHPVSTHPELAEDPANFRPSHCDCNHRRGNRAPFIELGTPSEDW